MIFHTDPGIVANPSYSSKHFYSIKLIKSIIAPHFTVDLLQTVPLGGESEVRAEVHYSLYLDAVNCLPPLFVHLGPDQIRTLRPLLFHRGVVIPGLQEG